MPGPDWLVHRYEAVTSTMERAGELARFGARERSAVVSAKQTAGRGRAGRAWHSPRGSALYCTLIVRPPVPPAHLSTLPLIAGVAVAETLELATEHAVRLKWPNDVWIGDDAERPKVAGILLSSSLRGSRVDFVLVGIGINISGNVQNLPAGATSLLLATGSRIARDELLTLLLGQFDGVYRDYLASEGRPSLATWRNRAALLGEHVNIDEAGRTLSGVFSGVDNEGALLLQEENGGVHRVVAGDLARGPRRIDQPR